MKYLKKIALVSDVTYNIYKLKVLPDYKFKIDDEVINNIINNTKMKIVYPELYIIHGALYEQDRTIKYHEDNLERINIKEFKTNKEDHDIVEEILKPNSNWTIPGVIKNLIEKLKLSPDVQKIPSDIIKMVADLCREYETYIYDKKFVETLEFYKGNTIYYNKSKQFYIDSTNNNIIDVKKLNLNPAPYDFEKPEVDKRLNNMVWSHGLFAYSYTWKKNLANLINHPEMEVSCSKRNQNIGNIGVYLMGDVVVASHTDIYSNKAKDYRRVWDPTYDIKNKPLLTKDNISDVHHAFAEIIVTNTEIIGMWVKNIKKDIKLEKEYEEKIAQYHDEIKKLLLRLQEYETKMRNLDKHDILDDDLNKRLYYISKMMDLITRNSDDIHWKDINESFATLYVNIERTASYIKDANIRRYIKDIAYAIRLFKVNIADKILTFSKALEDNQAGVEMKQEAENIARANGWPLTFLSETISPT